MDNMDDKFAKFHTSINNMRAKVIKAKGGQQVKGLSESVVVNDKAIKGKQAKVQEKI